MSAEAVNLSSEKAAVVAALQRASVVTGSDFHYLLGTAMRESSLKPQAQACRSSAAGLFQFVEQTWLRLVKDYGAKYGLASYASAIGKDADGRLHLDNAADRQAVLALRNDPQLSALMAGEYAQQTKAEMQSTLGRDVCGGELYAAHFLGADAACRLIRMNGSTPDALAASVFPQAASANRNVFYHADGTAKTIREVYGWALNQPSVAVPQTPVTTPPPPSPVTYGPDYSGLLASLWTPSKGFFSSGEGGNSAFPLTPGVLDILSSVSPVAKDDSGS